MAAGNQNYRASAISRPRVQRCIRFTAVCAAVLVTQIAMQFPVDADDPHLGVIEYEISCMPCHGVDGRGHGRLANTLKISPPDLTRIAKTNNGKFPFDRVAEIIDGRAIVAGHGERDMPVWGDRYRKRVEPNETDATIDRRARAQIAALVRYLETLQEK